MALQNGSPVLYDNGPCFIHPWSSDITHEIRETGFFGSRALSCLGCLAVVRSRAVADENNKTQPHRNLWGWLARIAHKIALF